jgi:hypothetical protein
VHGTDRPRELARDGRLADAREAAEDDEHRCGVYTAARW